jgi:hypothetical protein
MKNFLLIVALLVGYSSLGQTVKLYFPNDTNNINTRGAVINKGDTLDVEIFADGSGNTSTRALYFDFEYTNTALQLLGVTHTAAGVTIPANAQITMNFQDYPGYSWLSTTSNSVPNGNTRYQTANYNYTQGGSKSILRVYVNWSIATGELGVGKLLNLKYRLRPTAPGFAWDPIRMNFAAAFNQNGTNGSTIMTTPLTSVIMLDPTASRYVNPSLMVNANVNTLSLHRVAFTDSVANTTYLVDALSDGSIPVDQTRFSPNTVYHVRVLFNMDSVRDLSSAAVTVSDYTTAQAEFVTQNLDGTFKNQNITTGMGYYAADVNFNKTFDGGDLVRLFSQVTGVENLVTLPANYSAGTDMYMSVPTFDVATFDAATSSSWKTLTNNYVRFKTGNIGENLPLKLRFVIPGDINRSHSSQVMIGSSIATNAVPSLRKNFAASSTAHLLINTTQNIPSINVNLKNIVTTASTIDIPVEIDANTGNVAALQFEFTYDPTKIKFEQIINELPNTWYTFVENKEGKVKFGSIDKDVKNPVTGKFTPFKLRFSSVVNPLDLNTSIRVSPVMDAASKTGYQLGINLSTDTIKLTGYNNF